MSDSGPQYRPAEERVEALVAACLERAPDEPETVVDEVCSDDPELTDEVRGNLQALAALGLGFDERTRDGLPLRLGGFRLVRPLGAGAMGVVYLAEDQAHRREVALKILRPELLYFPRAQERFRREMRIVSGLEHPGIVRVHSHGETDGLPWIAMERMPGASLERVLSELSEVPVERRVGSDLVRVTRALYDDDSAPAGGEHPYLLTSWTRAALHVVRELAVALAHAHARGVVHRDVKPSNTLLTPDGRVLLFDFGLATDEPRGQPTLTRSGLALGSEAYMAPEVLGGESRADERSDVYALGVMLFELLTGERPYLSEGRAGFRRRVLEGRTPSARKDGAGVSQDADVVCHVALARDPARRYPSAQALADDLARVLEHQPIHARKPGPVARSLAWMRRRPLVTAAALVVVAALAVSAVLWQDNQRMQGEIDRARASVSDLLALIAEAVNRLEPETWGQRDPPASRLLEELQKVLEERQLPLDVSAEALTQFAGEYRELGRFDQARLLTEAAMAQWQAFAPDDMDVQARAAAEHVRSLIALGRNQDARVLALEWVDRDADPRALSAATRGDLLYLAAAAQPYVKRTKVGELLKEAQALRVAAGDVPGQIEVALRFARYHQGRGEHRVAREDVAGARSLLRQLDGADAGLRFRVESAAALVDELAGEWTSALAQVELLLADMLEHYGARHPRLAEAHAARGRILRRLGHHAEAHAELESALSILEHVADVHVDLDTYARVGALAAAGAGDAAGARALIGRARALLPDEPRTHVVERLRETEARVHHLLGEYAEAEQAYADALVSAAFPRSDSAPWQSWVGLNQGLARLARGRGDEALERFRFAEHRLGFAASKAEQRERWSAVDPRRVDLARLQGRTALLLGESVEALRHFVAVAELTELQYGEESWLCAIAWARVGEAQSALGEFAEAEALLLAGWRASVEAGAERSYLARQVAAGLVRLYEALGDEEQLALWRGVRGDAPLLVPGPTN